MDNTFYAQFGLLEPYMHDDEVMEIMINRFDSIYIEKAGHFQRIPERFADEAALRQFIDRMLEAGGGDATLPINDVRLRDGSRVHVILPPVATDGAVVGIRRYPKELMTMDILIEIKAISADAAAFLAGCVRARQNVIVFGGSRSGKSTVLNVLASFIPDESRIIVLQQDNEILIPQANVVKLEAQAEGRVQVTMTQLVESALRLNPYRIVAGEMRGGEVWPLFQAMALGNNVMLLLHASSPNDAIARLEVMAATDNPSIPLRRIRENIALSGAVMVQVELMRDGLRRLVRVSEIQPMRGDAVPSVDIFEYVETWMDGERIVGGLQPTGVVPLCLSAIQRKGIDVNEGMFARRE